jgi:Zn-dependent peptidase ImmA (M78 family)
MKRGFKTMAEADGNRLRRELDLRETDRLDPFALADYLGVPVVPLQRLLTHGASPLAVAFFKGAGRQVFSAATITDADGYSIVVYNERHADVRQCSNVCHELAHLILFHEPAPLVDDTGQRLWDREREDEASWMGATLLLPRRGMLTLLDRGDDVDHIAANFGVSVPLANWRIQMTGVRRQLAYRAAAPSRLVTRKAAPVLRSQAAALRVQ